MTLRFELWAAVDLLGGSVVTLKQGREDERTTWEGAPVDVAGRWEREGAHGVHVIDLDAAFGRAVESNKAAILSIIERAGIPVQVGGGVRSLEAAEGWLERGADRVVLGTLALSKPEALGELLRAHGPERIVVAADHLGGRIMTKGWTVPHEVGVMEAAKRLERAGVVNLLSTAVGADGMGGGPDVRTTADICSSTGLRVLASGGIRSARDIKELEDAGACGAILGRAIYDGSIRLSGFSGEEV